MKLRLVSDVRDDRRADPTADSPAGRFEGISDERLAALRGDLVRAVRRVCPRWLANERQDIVQLALVKLLDRAEKEGRPPDFSASYIGRVAYTHVVDEIRRRRRRRESSLEAVDGAGDAFVSIRPSPEDLSAGRELRSAIESCLEALSASRRDAMVLSLLGYPHAEIAERLGWNPKQAENFVTRARKQLRECLARKGFAP